ncbi:VPS4-associated protein 1 [Radiomyces spectabilis]|uniref:VPS4-associated protein 1 n=1 Tax=Radiomyces spectabilis TaxID=64574 RepID=UPI00221FE9AC|nr:VPS4-associated protein 1 [Radiomyces spectabilis]KAI8388472.1 VPS4-associated protein 1 [Radiomyces spectabilis]
MTQSGTLKNLYIARLTTQDRPCFVCSKFTAVVLTSADNSNTDWFYTCRTHLADSNFCTKVGSSPRLSTKGTAQGKKEPYKDREPESDSVMDLVSSIGSAWKSWRTKKPDDDKDKDKKEKEAKDDSGKETDKSESKREKSQDPPETGASSPTSESGALTPSKPTEPPKFVLHRDYFYLRQREHMKKQQKREASDKLKNLQFPEVPKTPPISKAKE